MLDELSAHAKLYRTRYLLKQGMPGRSAYPSEIFYSHSSILERSCKLNKIYMAGSITSLPIIKTHNNNITEYICTNLISITDGQLIFDKANYLNGYKPAISMGLSVSRIGSKCQPLAISILRNYNISTILCIQQHLDIYSYELSIFIILYNRNNLHIRNCLYLNYPYLLLLSYITLSSYSNIKLKVI